MDVTTSQSWPMLAISLPITPAQSASSSPSSSIASSMPTLANRQGRSYQNLLFKLALMGLAPPRTVSMLRTWGQPIPGDDLRSGDVVLFGQRDVVTHAGIYV